MKIGMIGIGKLGLPYALVLSDRGHEVVGYDSADAVRDAIAHRTWPHDEQGLPELLARTTLTVAPSIAEVVAHAEVVFIAVQTPHGPEYEGVTPLPETRADFDYAYLRAAVTACVESATGPLTLALVSTVLPGTLAREVVPLLHDGDRVVYNPSFIAMGSTIPDLLAPEFLLLGGSPDARSAVAAVWAAVHSAPTVETDIVTAEVIKVTYNAAIGSKIVLANTIMELCHRMGADADTVSDTFALATKRLVSPAYMRGGMGDSGGCHPRDGIALSWLARSLGMSTDFFGALMEMRERQTDWLAELIAHEHAVNGLPVVIVGQAYKAGTRLTVGSCGRLLVALLKRRGVEPVVWDESTGTPIESVVRDAAIYCLTVESSEVYGHQYPAGSVIIDPWGSYPTCPRQRIVRIGRPSPPLPKAGDPPRISVLIPTRARVDHLIESIASVRATARAPIEVLCWCDDDDATVERVRSDANADRIIVGKRLGYYGMAQMFAEMAAISRGDWLMLWNDDARMAEDHWDRVVEPFDSDAPWVIAPKPGGNDAVSDSCFPILSRGYVRKLPYIARHSAVDSYVCSVARRVDKLAGVGLEWKDQRLRDATDSRDGGSEPPLHWTDEIDARVREDAERLG